MADRGGLDRRDLLRGAGVMGLALAAGQGVSARAAVKALSGSSRMDWYKKPYRIVQTNLREIDVLEDPRKIARQIREFGGDTIVTNIGGIVAFYPTALEYQFRNPYLKGKRDFAREMIDASHAEGLAVIGRFDLSKSMKPTYDAHPDWFMLNRDGKPRTFAGTYQACPNGGWAQDYGVRILQEGLGRYDLDGVFFNMSGYPATDYANVAHGSCRCANCHRRFREMYGRELPAVDNFSDPAWPQYLEFQDRTSDELGEKNYRTIKAIRPDVAVLGHNLYNEVVRDEVQRRIHRAAPEWAFQTGEECRAVQARLPGKPMSATSAAHIDYPWRQVLESGSYHMVRYSQMLGTGAKPDLYLMGTFQGQDDHRFEAPLSDLYKWYARPEISAHYDGLAPGARVALYLSDRTERWGGGVPGGKKWSAGWRGAYTALVDRRIPFWAVSDDRVADGATKLSPTDYDAIIMPGVAILTDKEADALDDYVRAGGTLIATGQTGGYDGLGKVRPAMAMQSSPVLRYGDIANDHGWTFDAARASGIDLGGARIPATGDYYRATAASDAQNLLPRAPDQPFGPPELSYAKPDAPRGDEPGILVRRYGKGTSIHLPWQPDIQYYRDGLPDHSLLFAALIAKYAPPAQVKLNGAGPAELMVMRHPATSRLLIHVINYSGQRNGLYTDPAKLHDLRIGVRGGKVADALVAGTSLQPSADKDGYSWYALPPVGYFEALSVAVG